MPDPRAAELEDCRRYLCGMVLFGFMSEDAADEIWGNWTWRSPGAGAPSREVRLDELKRAPT